MFKISNKTLAGHGGARLLVAAFLVGSVSVANAQSMPSKALQETTKTSAAVRVKIAQPQTKETSIESAKRQKAAVLLFLKAITGTKL